VAAAGLYDLPRHRRRPRAKHTCKIYEEIYCVFSMVQARDLSPFLHALKTTADKGLLSIAIASRDDFVEEEEELRRIWFGSRQGSRVAAATRREGAKWC
jgi:hypothetical protein